MKDGLDWKKFQFITQVQTALIGNALAEACESKGQVRREIFSSIAMLNKMQTAFVAAEQIPEAISAHEAACEIDLLGLIETVFPRRRRVAGPGGVVV